MGGVIPALFFCMYYLDLALIKRIKLLLGHVDVDALGNSKSAALVGADYYGSSAKWKGNVLSVVWNAPYTNVNTAMSRYMSNDVAQVLVVTKTSPGAKWWDKIFHHWRFPVCISRGCMKFTTAAGNVVQSKVATSFFYMAPEGKWHRFVEVFSPIGRVILP
jgi:hypothetical protein